MRSEANRRAFFHDSSARAAIAAPSIDLPIWRGTVPFDPMPLITGTLRDVRFLVPVDDVAPALPGNLAAAGYPSDSVCDALSADVCDLARLFGRWVSSDRFEIRLDHVTTNACRKFHADYVEAWLLVTYAASGTECSRGKRQRGCRREERRSRLSRPLRGTLQSLRAGWAARLLRSLIVRHRSKEPVFAVCCCNQCAATGTCGRAEMSAPGIVDAFIC